MRPFHLAPLLALLATPAVYADAAGDTAALASQLADHVSETRYSHRGLADAPNQPNIQRNGDGDYRAYTDCSGFVTYVLAQTAPKSLAHIRHLAAEPDGRKKWPQAFVFQQYFESLGNRHGHGWKGITDLREVGAGDVVSWCLDQHCAGAEDDDAQAEDTGHIMIASGPAQTLDGHARSHLMETLDKRDAHLPPGTATVLALPVIDSSTLHHYNDPTRSKAAGQSGLGRGSIYVAIDTAGAPIGFEFPGGAFHYTRSKGGETVQTVHFGIGRPLE